MRVPTEPPFGRMPNSSSPAKKGHGGNQAEAWKPFGECKKAIHMTAKSELSRGPWPYVTIGGIVALWGHGLKFYAVCEVVKVLNR